MSKCSNVKKRNVGNNCTIQQWCKCQICQLDTFMDKNKSDYIKNKSMIFSSIVKSMSDVEYNLVQLLKLDCTLVKNKSKLPVFT